MRTGLAENGGAVGAAVFYFFLRTFGPCGQPTCGPRLGCDLGWLVGRRDGNDIGDPELVEHTEAFCVEPRR